MITNRSSASTGSGRIKPRLLTGVLSTGEAKIALRRRPAAVAADHGRPDSGRSDFSQALALQLVSLRARFLPPGRDSLSVQRSSHPSRTAEQLGPANGLPLRSPTLWGMG